MAFPDKTEVWLCPCPPAKNTVPCTFLQDKVAVPQSLVHDNLSVTGSYGKFSLEMYEVK